MKINAARLKERFDALGKIGRLDDGGYARFAYTDEEKAATTLVEGWMKEAGLEVRFDAGLNLFGRLRGSSARQPILTGSHLDSVPHGGNFDGPAGVLCGLEALQTLAENGITPAHSIELVAFQGEEGSRFPIGLLGSYIAAGTFKPEPDKVVGKDGTTLADALKARGGDPSKLHDAKAGCSAFIELHIEQAGSLEAQNLSCGVVTHIAGMKQFKGVIEGRTDHAGACAMDLRRDTLLAAAELQLEVEKAATGLDPATRATVGFVRGFPGAANVIAGRTEFSLDVRDQDPERRDACVDRIRTALKVTGQKRKIKGTLTEQHASAPVPCTPEIIQAIETSAADSGIAVTRLPSGAVHDASNMAAVAPIGMIFVRSRDGISHSPAEYSSPEDLADGAQLLMGTLRHLAS